MPSLNAPLPAHRPVDRRRVLAGGLAAVGAAAVPRLVRAEAKPRNLSARPARASLLGRDAGPETAVLAYDGTVPGPELRFRRGDVARIAFSNGLDAETTVHWHGLRVPNAMDGVPHLSHPPIPPGGRFDYVFALKDAGTFWYHPHADSARQLGRGLSGAFVVEEPEPPRVDRELLWLLADWRLDGDGAIADDFGNPMDATHAGRLGNVATLNGRVGESVAVRAGERLRLRLVNAASARVFALRFEGQAPTVAALDGHPVAPHAPDGGRVVLAPGQRADLILDVAGDPGASFDVTDSFLQRQTYRLTRLALTAEAPLRSSPLDASTALPANPLPRLDLAGAARYDVVLEGGMHGPREVDPMEHPGGPFWWLNGLAAMSHAVEPMIQARSGQTVALRFVNDSDWWHPMHLHGFPFRVLSRNGVPAIREEWRDTVLLGPRESAEVAFVAEEPGHWMLHCHVLEHQETGMMAVLRVV